MDSSQYFVQYLPTSNKQTEMKTESKINWTSKEINNMLNDSYTQSNKVEAIKENQPGVRLTSLGKAIVITLLISVIGMFSNHYHLFDKKIVHKLIDIHHPCSCDTVYQYNRDGKLLGVRE